LIGRHRARRRIVGREQLEVGVEEALAGIGTRHQVRMLRRGVDLEHLDLTPNVIRIGLIADQALIRLVGRRPVAVGRIEKAEHLVE
jgi:hypothetical protein